jgi:four helix bundle protein
MESTEKKKKHITLADLEVYQLAWELSKTGWKIYEVLDWQTKKLMGDQFISATNSFGTNIAEGYGCYHYLDKIRFFYNARASLAEAREHWLELLKEREKVSEEVYKESVQGIRIGCEASSNKASELYFRCIPCQTLR